MKFRAQALDSLEDVELNGTMNDSKKRPRTACDGRGHGTGGLAPMQDASYIRIPLRAKDGSVRAYTLIDAADAPLAEHRWYLDSSGYAQRFIGRFDGKSRLIGLHRAVLGLEFGDGWQADHINGDRLDNRRQNLRRVTIAQNRQNQRSRGGSSKYRGVSWVPSRGKWAAYAKIGGRMHHAGEFQSEQAAADAARALREQGMTHTVETRT